MRLEARDWGSGLECRYSLSPLQRKYISVYILSPEFFPRLPLPDSRPLPLILLIDNYDSFVFNLARYFERLGRRTLVVRNDQVDVAAVKSLKPVAIVLSPGPCTPTDAGCSIELVNQLHDSIPMLGVCLGHQTIAAALGGTIIRAPQPMHGRASTVAHCGERLFAGIANPMLACRYHSLIVEAGSLPDVLTVTATTNDGVIMAFEHRTRPVFGVQFHPESVLTDQGYLLLANFLRLASIDAADVRGLSESELPGGDAIYEGPRSPVTF